MKLDKLYKDYLLVKKLLIYFEILLLNFMSKLYKKNVKIISLI